MAEPSPEQRKLQLVEKLEFRILGVANQEKKLHDLLQTFLAPLILEVASEYATVRTRVRCCPLSSLCVRMPNIVRSYKFLEGSKPSSSLPGI
jgi:proteasome component ECM29